MGLDNSDAYRHIQGKGDPRWQGLKIASHQRVKDRVLELQEEAKERLIQKCLYDHDWVVKELMENVDTAKRGITTFQGKTAYMTDEHGKVLKDEDGNATPVYKRDHNAIQRTLELLGLELGMFPRQAKVEHQKSDPFSGMSTEEVLLQAKNQMESELGWTIDMTDLMKLVGIAREENSKSDGSPALPAGD